MEASRPLLALAGLFISGVALAAPPSFTIETVDRSSNQNRQVALKLAADGKVRVVYTGCSDSACSVQNCTAAGLMTASASDIGTRR